MIPGAGHVPMEDRTDVFNEALIQFLRDEAGGDLERT